MKYILVAEHSVHALTTKVNEYLASGYRCQGGANIATDTKKALLIQAMIKE